MQIPVHNEITNTALFGQINRFEMSSREIWICVFGKGAICLISWLHKHKPVTTLLTDVKHLILRSFASAAKWQVHGKKKKELKKTKKKHFCAHRLPKVITESRVIEATKYTWGGEGVCVNRFLFFYLSLRDPNILQVARTLLDMGWKHTSVPVLPPHHVLGTASMLPLLPFRRPLGCWR